MSLLVGLGIHVCCKWGRITAF